MTQPPGQGWQCVCGVSGLTTIYCPYCGRASPWYTAPLYIAPEAPPRQWLDRRGKQVATVLVLTLFFALNRLVVRIEAREAGERRARRAALERVVTELEAFVAQRHGGPFTKDVDVRLLPDKKFAEAMRFGATAEEVLDDPTSGDGATQDEAEPEEDFGATLLALRLADPGDASADDAAETLLGEGVYGFYEHRHDRLYVRSRDLTPFAKLVLVHELTHAWQDQHYDLGRVRPRGSGKDDEDRAVSALIEGDASRVENDWREAQSDADKAAIEAGERGGSGRTLTRTETTLGAFYGFPYALGERFVRAVERRGGREAVDAAFANPPRSTEEILHPDRYARGTPPPHPATPKADGAVVDDGILGEVGLLVLLGRGRPDEAGARAAAGWAGDAYVTWADATRSCTRLAVTMDDAAARDRLAAALRNGVPDARVRDAGPRGLVLDSCSA